MLFRSAELNLSKQIDQILKVFERASESELLAKDLIDICYVSFSAEIDSKVINALNQRIKSLDIQLRSGHMEKEGKHIGASVVNLLMHEIQDTLNSQKERNDFLRSVSILIPIKNEIRTISKVLDELMKYDWIETKMIVEVIVVDGGSHDDSDKIGRAHV